MHRLAARAAEQLPGETVQREHLAVARLAFRDLLSGLEGLNVDDYGHPVFHFNPSPGIQAGVGSALQDAQDPVVIDGRARDRGPATGREVLRDAVDARTADVAGEYLAHDRSLRIVDDVTAGRGVGVVAENLIPVVLREEGVALHTATGLAREVGHIVGSDDLEHPLLELTLWGPVDGFGRRDHKHTAIGELPLVHDRVVTVAGEAVEHVDHDQIRLGRVRDHTAELGPLVGLAREGVVGVGLQDLDALTCAELVANAQLVVD